MKRIKNRNVFLLLTIILSLGITLGAVYFMYQYRDSRENKLKTGMISLNFTEKSEVINLSSNVPMIDDLGLKSRPYEFTITNTSKVPIKASIKLDIDNTTNIKLGAVRYGLYIDDEMVIKDYVHSDNLTLYEESELVPNEVLDCKLYFWVDYYYDEPGKIFKGKIKAVGESSDELQGDAITVTFDADGGTLDTSSKQVYYHGQYGELPTPTKSGYTFMGWNGKNLIYVDNMEEETKNGITGLVIKGIYKITGTSTSNSSFGLLNKKDNMPMLEKGNKYTLSVSPNIAKRGAYVSLNYISTSNVEKSFIYEINNQNNSRSGIVPEDYDKLHQLFVGIYYDATNIDETFSIQLEEGEEATEYEPYYITSSTKVVQNENHTLKAIWKENS